MTLSKLGVFVGFFGWVVLPAGTQAQTARAGAPSAEARSEAREHFQRGLDFFNEERHDAALAEFQRAHELVPSAEALYNLGRVHSALGNAVEAVAAFEAYLAESNISADRRREVTERRERQKARIAEVWIDTNIEGAIVSVDGVDRTSTPMRAPLLVNAGSHAVSVRAPEHDQTNLSVRVAGGEVRRLPVELRRVDQRGTLRVEANLHDVEIRVDGQLIGRTPLGSTVPLSAGHHVVVATRAGYEAEQREITIEASAEARLTLNLRRSEAPAPADVGSLQLRLPEAPHVLRIDGETVPTQGGVVSLPRGPHSVQVSVADRQPVAQEITIPAGGTLDINFNFQWTPEVASQLREDASRQTPNGPSPPGCRPRRRWRRCRPPGLE